MGNGKLAPDPIRRRSCAGALSINDASSPKAEQMTASDSMCVEDFMAVISIFTRFADPSAIHDTDSIPIAL
jgi:hypothetical protein